MSRRLSDDPQCADSGATKSAGFVQHGSRNAAPLIELRPDLDVVDTLESQTAFSFRRTASVICTRHTGEERRKKKKAAGNRQQNLAKLIQWEAALSHKPWLLLLVFADCVTNIDNAD